MTTSEDLNEAIWTRSGRNASVVRSSDSGGATTRTVFVADDVVVVRSSTLRALLQVAGDQVTLAEALGVSRSTISRALAEAGETSSDRQARIETVRSLLCTEQTVGKNDATPRAALAPEEHDPPSGALPTDDDDTAGTPDHNRRVDPIEAHSVSPALTTWDEQ